MPAARTLAFVLFAIVALTATGCGSNNTGKIVGKWKITSGPGINAEELKMLEAAGVVPYMEFKADGTVTTGAESGTYKLLTGDNVELSGIGEAKGRFGSKAKAGRVKITIVGDNMTIVAADGTLQMTRMK